MKILRITAKGLPYKKTKDIVEVCSLLSYTNVNVLPFTDDVLLEVITFKKSDAYQSGFLEGTTPAYEAYMRLKKTLAASSC